MKKIAIIGTGLSGLAAGYFLKNHAEITFYDKNDYPGGQLKTVAVEDKSGPLLLDIGVLAYRESESPLLTRFIKELNLPTTAITMNYSVHVSAYRREYGGSGMGGLFGQRTNFLNLHHWSMIWQMGRFWRESPEVLKGGKYQFHTIGDYVQEKKYRDVFLNAYLIPLSALVWSSRKAKITDLPISTLVRFLRTHGFWGLKGSSRWQTVVGGNRTYRERVFSQFPGHVLINTPVTEISREFGKVTVFDGRGERNVFDAAIIACPADQALALLGSSASPAERWLLKEFQYHRCRASVHTDAGVMPQHTGLWSAYNFRLHGEGQQPWVPMMTYHLNALQKLSTQRHYFLTVNDSGLVDPAKIMWQGDVDYPIFSLGALKAQADLPQLNQEGPVYFCGSYFRYGLQEDAFVSGLEVAQRLLGERIWT